MPKPRDPLAHSNVVVRYAVVAVLLNRFALETGTNRLRVVENL